MFTRRRILQSSAALSAGLVGLSAKAADPIVFAVNEGVTYRTSTADFRERFEAVGGSCQAICRQKRSAQRGFLGIGAASGVSGLR